MLLCFCNLPDKNTRVGSHSLLQGIFVTQISNPGLLNCRQILHHLSHDGSPGKQGDKSNSQSDSGLCVIVTTAAERPAPGGVLDPGDSRNGAARMPVRTPYVRPGLGWCGAEGTGLLVLWVLPGARFCLGPILQGGHSSGGSARV